MCSVRTVLLFYKRLIEPGGAERLLLHEYEELTQLGYQVQIVTYELRDKALFGFQRDQLHIIELLGSPSQSWWQLVQLCRLHRQDIWLCASGHIDIFLASIIAGSRYALHVHHPAFMSFNDYDKYSIFLQSHFEDLLRSNFGAVRFQKIREQLTIAQKIRLNIRAALSILSLKKASEIFVLSTYAQQEKKRLYKVDSKVLCGALEMCQVERMVAPTEAKNNNTITIFTVARLDINKRIDELINAFAIFYQKEPNARLVIGGRGPEKEALEALALQLNLQNQVVFLGFINDSELQQRYANADLFVSIDWADYKITLFESLAMQTKVLVSEETEIDAQLIASGYVFAAEPQADKVAEKIAEAVYTQPNWTVKQLQQYLLDYTWPRYVKKIAYALESV